jgi:hypothetical protein
LLKISQTESWVDRNIGKSRTNKIGAVIITCLLIGCLVFFLSCIHYDGVPSPTVSATLTTAKLYNPGMLILQDNNNYFYFHGFLCTQSNNIVLGHKVSLYLDGSGSQCMSDMYIQLHDGLDFWLLNHHFQVSDFDVYTGRIWLMELS